MSSTAYELRAEYAEPHGDESDTFEHETTFQGAVLATPSGDFDVAKELERGGGLIVVPDTDDQLRDMLDNYPALKRADASGLEPTISRYRLQTRDELAETADRLGVDGARGLNKAQLINALEAIDRGEDPNAAAEGEDPRLRQSREDLNRLAAAAGVDNPEALPNKTAVLEAYDSLEA